MAPAIRILHFSDVLCVWAFVSQVRIDELRSSFGRDIDVDVRFCTVFGNARGKLEGSWADRGGLRGYGAHVREVVSRFDHVDVHPEVWASLCPASSLSCHQWLCAVRHLERSGALDPSEGNYQQACWLLREAFFRELRDVSQRGVQLELAEQLSIPRAGLERCLDDGIAHAELAEDMLLVREHDVKMSPTLILDEGRQRLNGNVGYRVIDANVRELLRQPEGDTASWC